VIVIRRHSQNETTRTREIDPGSLMLWANPTLRVVVFLRAYTFPPFYSDTSCAIVLCTATLKVRVVHKDFLLEFGEVQYE
jgi:hypothetical protein